MRRLLVLAALALAGCGCGADERADAPAQAPTTTPVPPPAVPSPPAPDEPVPHSPRRLAARLKVVDRALRHDLDAWLASSPGRRAQPPARIALEALFVQRSYRQLARRPRFARTTIRRLPRWLRPEARDSVGALHALFTLTSLATEVRFRTGPPAPPGELRAYYREAQRRFRVRWNVLAAINFIESNFGRLRNVSNAGAVGPMQFLPATWRVYGMGGDIRDPHDAVLGAANYLRSSGAPRSYSRALYAYNPSPLYVRAVLLYARRMARDRRAFWFYWNWQSFKRTRHGERQLTGPGSRP